MDWPANFPNLNWNELEYYQEVVEFVLTEQLRWTEKNQWKVYRISYLVNASVFWLYAMTYRNHFKSKSRIYKLLIWYL